MILDYIEALAPGTKISVRELAEVLPVSEGTAYKAIKEAEQLGLVTIRPKAGTVRVDTRSEDLAQNISAAEVSRLLGLTVAAGKSFLTRPIRRLVVCDGSEADLLRQLQGQQPRNILCLCGDRPSLQTAALEQGVNLLLTGGAKASWTLISAAERREAYILTSPKDSCSLLRMFDSEYVYQEKLSGSGTVGEWMQTPEYLYYNDIVADWQRLYTESSLIKQYPIVDDELGIYGGLELWAAATAVPSQRLRSLVGEKELFPRVSLNDSIRDTARKFVINGDVLAAVMDGRQMVGLLTASDLLRYYLASETGARDFRAEAFLEWDQAASTPERAVYTVRIPRLEKADLRHLEADLLLSAAGEHIRRQGGSLFQLESGTFFTSGKLSAAANLILTSQLRRTGGDSFTLEAEINDEQISYARAIFLASARHSEEE